MTHSIVFDTLSYVKMLDKGGVEHAEIHSALLSKVLTQNIYTKKEVDHMIDQALNRIDETFRRSDKRLEEFRREYAADRAEADKKFAEIELRLEKSVNRYIITTISILGTLTIVMNTISTFAHYIFH